MHRCFLLAFLLLSLACGDDINGTDSASGGSTGSTGTTNTTDSSTGTQTGEVPTSGTGTAGESATGTVGESATGTGGATGACAYIVGKTFLSDEELGCGLGGPCHWMVAFTEAMFTYDYSDVSDLGPYTCEDGTIVGTGNAKTYMGVVDAEAGTLMWEGVAYTVAP